MANITKLAIKLVADMEKAQKDFSAMSSTIANIEKSAKTATPSMKNLTDSVKGLGMMQSAVAKAQESHAGAALEEMEQTQKLVSETTAAYNNMQETVQRMGQSVGDDILQMRPTISNVQKAQGEVEKLIALQREMGENGHLLNDAVVQAQANMAELGNKTFQTNTEMMMLKSAINGLNMMPFMVLSTLMADMVKGMKEFGSEFNERFGGMPGKIAQATAAVLALTVALGLAFAKTTALGLSTSYFMTLWKSSAIYQGLAGVITMLNTILGTQIAITAATTAWVAVATLGLGVLIAAITTYAMSWFDTSKAIQQSEESMQAMEKATQKAIDRFRELNNIAKNALESLMTPAERLVAKLKELDAVRQAPNEIQAELQKRMHQQRMLLREADGNKGFWGGPKKDENLEAMMQANMAQIGRLREALGQAVHINDAQFKALQENARIESLKEQYGSLFEKTLTAQEQYNNTLDMLNADLKAKRITDMESDRMRDNLDKQLRNQLGMTESPAEKFKTQIDLLQFALEKQAITKAEFVEMERKAMEQFDPAMKAAAEAAKKLAQEQQRAAAEFKNMADRFKGMGKTPIESFKELSVDLRNVRHALAPAQFTAARNKLLADLASGLGIAPYLTDSANAAQQLATTYKNLEAYAREANLSMRGLTAAKNRARAALEKQSEYYNLYQRAQEAMLTTQQRLNREMTRIADEAAKWGWDFPVMQKMMEMKAEEILGKIDFAPDIDTDGKRSIDQSRNAAVEHGTVAYYEAQMKGNKPLVDEAKKTNNFLNSIDKKMDRPIERRQEQLVMLNG